MSPTKFLPLVLCAAASCRTAPPVHLSSSPPGAIIIVDGQETGFATPCAMDLANAPQRLVEFRLSGYETATRLLHMRDMTHLVFWREASGDLKTWNFPLWLGSEDFFIPRKTLTGESPARVHVHLRRQADQ